jgi:hypothetical protein
MGKKLNKGLLSEELKRFRILSEFKFYTEEPEKQDDDLILGSNLGEADEDAENQEQPAEEPADAPADDSKTATNQEDTPSDDENIDFSGGENPEDQADNTQFDDTQSDTPEMVDAPEMGDETEIGDTPEDTSDEVEVDVTQLVKGSEEAKLAASDASQKTAELLNKFSDLERRVAAMDAISSKIDTLEKEIVKRNPTPVEKLEMRAMDSFPYNIKLNDYFKDVAGYDFGAEKKPKEYVLTKDDVNTTYSDESIKKSFNVSDDYTEEDI